MHKKKKRTTIKTIKSRAFSTNIQRETLRVQLLCVNFYLYSVFSLCYSLRVGSPFPPLVHDDVHDDAVYYSSNSNRDNYSGFDDNHDFRDLYSVNDYDGQLIIFTITSAAYVCICKLHIVIRERCVNMHL